MKYLIRIAFFLMLILPFQSHAGWLINGRFIDREGNTIMKRYFIEDNVIKVEQYNLLYICNLKTESIIIVDPVNLVYTKTSLSAYIAKMRQIKMNRLNDLLALIPADQKKNYEDRYRAQAEQDIILPAFNDDSLQITKLPDSVKLLGYPTLKFNIYDTGRKKEEFFMTPEVNISADLDMKTFLKYVYLLEPDDHTVKYMTSAKYLETVKNGFVTRRFMFEDGYRTEWQVNKIDKKDIPAYEFGAPDLCKEVTLDKWLNRKSNVDENYYDDYE
jgi:hypothetical protein